ncbi:MAG: hypothetical protein ACO1QS_12370 [Verrucomicrobiota bacterium]
MNNPAELVVMCLLGFTAILCTRPLIARFRPSWRWTWGPIFVAIHALAEQLLGRLWSDYQGTHGFFVFFAGAVLASTLLTILDKRNEEKVR